MNSFDFAQQLKNVQATNVVARCARICNIANVRPRTTEQGVEISKCKQTCPQIILKQLNESFARFTK